MTSKIEYARRGPHPNKERAKIISRKFKNTCVFLSIYLSADHRNYYVTAEQVGIHSEKPRQYVRHGPEIGC